VNALQIQHRNHVKYMQYDGLATIVPVPLPTQVGNNPAGTVPPAALQIPANFAAIGALTLAQVNGILAFYGIQIPAGATLQLRQEMVRDFLIGGIIP
jgi:hypothetical protein